MTDLKRSQTFFDPLIAHAVKCMPQTPPPPNLLPSILSQIQPHPTNTRPSFSFSWLTLALSLFATFMVGLVSGTILITLQNVHPQEWQWFLLMLRTPDPALVSTGVFLGGSLLILGIILLVVAGIFKLAQKASPFSG